MANLPGRYLLNAAICCSALSLLASPARAQVEHRFWNTNSSTTHQEGWVYNNFSMWPFSGQTFDTLPAPPGEAGVKYFNYDFYLTANSPTGCYEFRTEAVTGNMTNTDTRIYALENSTTWRSVSDDVSPGTNNTSFVRVWIGAMRGINFRVQPFVSALNHIDFRFHVHRRKETTEASCQMAGRSFLRFTSGAYPTFVVSD